MCDELGVRYFSRKGVEHYNRKAGPFKTKSKHGNYNSWLDAHGSEYDFMISVDSDHVPLANFAERFLGYFRDPDVAFVVGPQVYGNYEGFVTRSAESQQFLFHSLLQRAGQPHPHGDVRGHQQRRAHLGAGRHRRPAGLDHRGPGDERGHPHGAESRDRPSLDIGLHAGRDRRRRGPRMFTDFFSQQYRWSRGSNDVLLRRFWRTAHRLTPRQFLNYSLLMAYYPTTAIAWTLGVVNSAAVHDACTRGGVQMPVHLWLMLYVDVAAIQTGLYFWNRRHNVSPHESQGSRGVAGMFISALSVPVYVSSLIGSVLRRKSGFVVTAKGDVTQSDCLATFAKHLRWAAVIAMSLVASVLLGNKDPWMYLWSGLSMLWCACCRSRSGV